MTLLGGAKLNPTKLFARSSGKRRASSVDLTIGTMLDEKGTDLGKEHSLLPGQMVFVVSEEVFSLPGNVTGFVSCKTALTHDGVWAITVGIVDPCYVGPIATSLINFGKNARPLCRGMQFLRVAFFEHDPHKQCDEKDWEDETNAYHIDAKQHSVKFPSRFLNQDELAQTAVEKTWARMRRSAVIWGGLLAIFFSAMQVASVAVDRYFFSRDLVRPASDRVEALEGRIDRLEERLDGRPDSGGSDR